MPAVRSPAADSGPSLNSRSLPAAGQSIRAEVLQAWGDWVSQYDWDWWVTLTFDPRKVPSKTGTHTAVGWRLSDRYWHDWLTTSIPAANPYWIRGREPNKWRYGTHFHALVGGVPTGTSRKHAWAAWRRHHGLARLEPYDSARGAGYYVSKYVVKELGDIVFSENFQEIERDERSD